MNDQDNGMVQPSGMVVYPERRIRLGTVAVDSGRLLLADPTYIRNHGEIDNLDDSLMGDRHAKQTLRGMGMLFTAGLGDGTYEVYATVGTVIGWGERVKRVEVVLIEDDTAQTRADRNVGIAGPPTTGSDPAMRSELLEMAEGMKWAALPIKSGEAAGGTESMWRAFTAGTDEETLRLAVDAAWDQWVETDLSSEMAGCCTPGRPCGDHFDDVFEAWRDQQTERHWSGA